jgi:hypothetical protein
MDINMDMDTDTNNSGSADPFQLNKDLIPDSSSPVDFDRWHDVESVTPNARIENFSNQDSLDLNLQHPQETRTSNDVVIATPKVAPFARPTPEDKKELCIQKLSGLSASLMKNLNRLTTCTLATSFIFTPSDDNTAEYLFRTVDGSSGQENAIGRVLQSTEEFVQILKTFREALLGVAPPPYSAKDEEGREEGRGSLDNQQAHTEESNSEDETVRRWELVHSYANHARHQTLPPSRSKPFPNRVPNTNHSIPSTLIILTCYVSILKSFENIFSSLQRWLSIPFTSALRQHLALVVADFQINGFALDGYCHRNLQFKILVQVCQHMVDTLERAVWFDDYDGSGVIADSGFRGLLLVVLKEEGLDDGDFTGIGRIRHLLEKAVSMLN